MMRTSDEIPYSEHNARRMRRAWTWREQSRKAGSDEEKFLFLWIAFNAAYGDEPTGRYEDAPTESMKITEFLREIIKRDAGETIRTILWETYSGPIRILLENHYVFRPFWQYVRGEPMGEGWRRRFESRKERTRRSIGTGDVHAVFREVFGRLYQLRNQVFHGGVTFGEGWGRTQLRDGARIMEKIVPAILDVMQADIEKNPDSEVWGKVAYPRVGESPS